MSRSMFVSQAIDADRRGEHPSLHRLDWRFSWLLVHLGDSQPHRRRTDMGAIP